MPAQAGIHDFARPHGKSWIPACAGMTLVDLAAMAYGRWHKR